MGGTIQTILVFILVLSVLVFVHELGHFLFAKRAGILVREFAIGFGPKVFSRKKGETIYSIRILPLGGYVRMAGEDPEVIEIKTGTYVYAKQNESGMIDHIYLYEPEQQMDHLLTGRVVEIDVEKKLFLVLESDSDEDMKFSLDPQAMIHYDSQNEVQIAPWDRQFGSKTPGQKAMTIFAGPLFNIILTIILFGVYTAMTGVEARLPVEKLEPGSAGAIAGIQPNDVITAVNGNKVNTLDMLRYQLIESKGNEVAITVERNGKPVSLLAKPVKKGESYYLGVFFNEMKMKRSATIGEIVGSGFTLTYDWTRIILDGFRQLFTFQLSLDSLGGPVQMGSITGKAAEQGIVVLVKWMALLSLNLGLFNLVPIPALDGSRLIFIGIEAIRGRPVSPNKESMVHFVGFALLMMLMLVVTYNDIVRLFFT